jgi:hypothetical protein
MRHAEIAGGLRHMDIDHFDPTLKGSKRNAYSNLMLATHHCNMMKADGWPNASQIAAGQRILNPTKETDYGECLFEDPETHEIIGTTPAGKYHIDVLDLNHETFVFERQKRAEYSSLVSRSPARVSGTFDAVYNLLGFVHKQFDLFIPAIPPPPA